MERKIGEIFEYNGEWYQCVEGNCTDCHLYNSNICDKTKGKANNPFWNCHKFLRTDDKFIIFKKLEKAGEPYMLEDKKFQKYKVFKTPYIYNKIDCSWQSFADPYYVSLEIKPTKEDMEEKKLNLKPFDLQKAKEGKPVCTRDGRKARIICFDAKMKRNIIALIQDNEFKDEEIAVEYFPNGCFYDNDFDTSLDLMMPPEKKDGWVNIVIGSNGSPHMGRGIFQSKEEAENAIKAFSDNLIDTVKISWEE